jgi:hypothetical protein
VPTQFRPTMNTKANHPSPSMCSLSSPRPSCTGPTCTIILQCWLRPCSLKSDSSCTIAPFTRSAAEPCTVPFTATRSLCPRFSQSGLLMCGSQRRRPAMVWRKPRCLACSTTPCEQQHGMRAQLSGPST